MFIGNLSIEMEELVFYKQKRIKGDIARLKEIDDVDRNLFKLFSAILEVDSQYVDSDITHKRLERVFAYELYHQWSKQVVPNKKDNNESYILNGETMKLMGYFKVNPQKEKAYPDLILHKSFDHPKCQAIVCEIKRRGNLTKGGFEYDIIKLEEFVCDLQNDYSFNFGIFILAGDKMKSIIEMIDSLGWTSRRQKNKTENILLVAYDGCRIQVVSLYDALKKEEREKYLHNHNNEE